MSSSIIVEPQEGSSKKDDTLILMVNDNGVISVDQDTLQSLILNQSNAAVSVVRLGQTGNDVTEGNITLTVDPPSFVSSETNVTNNPDSTALVDPFMEMDQESLERLETALQSEEAKQILGENVTAMLDMLTVEEQQNSLRYSIELDHCYTSRSSPSQSKSTDLLPDISLSDMDESACTDINKSANASQILSVSSNNINNNSNTLVKQKITPTPPKIVKQPGPVGGRPRRSSNAMQPVISPKTPINTNARILNSQQEKLNTKDDETGETDEIFSSSDSSASEETDSDSDFGPRSSRRGVRSRGGRRGLTTRGGSMAASRRRGSNKHMDSDQVRRLDLEMAAAVSAMKSPEKEDKSEKQSPGKNKKLPKTYGVKKKEEMSPPVISISDPSLVEANVLQTTNQVKANLINANMFKGDMILTKPGQDRNNQKVVFVHKQIAMNPNDIKTLGLKKQVIIPKNKLITSQGSKVPVIKDIQILSAGNPAIIKNALVQQQPIVIRQNVPTADQPNEAAQSSVYIQKGSPAVLKIKPPEIKKEKKKPDGITEIPAKAVIETPKPVEVKTPIAPKKIVKKEHRKSDTLVVEALGPALFSTPDIIRRVGSTETKALDALSVTPSTPTSNSNTNVNAPTVNTTTTNVSTTLSSNNTVATTASNVLDDAMEPNIITNDLSNTALSVKLDDQSLMMSDNLGGDKLDAKTAIAALLQPDLDTASKPTTSQEIPSTVEQNDNSKQIVSETGIEGDDHLLATLGMDPAKQLANDEELLAEALLLQETLGVDLDQSGLVDPTADLQEPILSSSVIEPSQALPIDSSTVIKTDIPQSTGLGEVAASPTIKTEPMQKKDMKEPIQIIRGGRVITLPPIEAPATRSKRLQSKAESQVKVVKKPQQRQQFQKIETASVKNERTPRASTHVSVYKQDMIYNMDDDEEDEQEPNSDSEDDPTKLWCICRQPHNNRFMICCDMCEDWFHGTCVAVTKVMGEQMEADGREWVCPKCKKEGQPSKSKLGSRRQRNSVDSATVEKNRTPSVSNVTNKPEVKAAHNSGKNPSTPPGVTHCVVCKKEARKSSIYCSDACILVHAENTSTKPISSPQVKTPKGDGAKLKADARIVVFDKKTGKLITGADAPTASNLRTWLKEHPTCEVFKPNNLNTIQLGGKTVAAIQTPGIKINKPVQGKSPGQAKMIYTKMPGSKQTVLAANAKKAALTPDTPSGSATPSAQQRPKQQTPAKSLKQTTIKASLQNQQQQQQQQQQQLQQPNQQQTPQKPMAASTPKPAVSRKSQEVVKPPTPQQKQQQTPPPKKPEAEQMRLTVRKTLADLLIARIKEAEDLSLSEEEVIEIALQIEIEMYKFFKDTGSKYKAKYRSLVFNVKDPKNLTLFRKIADRSLTPEAVVKLSPEEMASQELAEWREKETKHQLEMIKKNELDMMAQAKSIVVKTHKGEQIIENDGGIESIDLKTPVQDIVTALNSGETTPEDSDKLKEDELSLSKFFDGDDKKKKKKEKDRDREKRRDRSRDRDGKDGGKRDRSRSKSRHRHRERSRDRKSKKEKHKGRDRTRDKEHDKSRHRDKKKDKEDDRKRKRSRSSSRSHNKDHKDKHKQKEDEKKKGETASKGEAGGVNADKPIEERLWRHIEDETTTNTLDGNDSDISDREPSSTVTIKTPDINDELDKDLDLNLPEIKSNDAVAKGVMTIWRGIVHMTDVAKFNVTAQNVSGNSKELMENLPGQLDVVGRISPATVWDYIAKMRKHPNKEIVIIKLTATNDEEKIPYITLYSYLNSRSRLGVVGRMGPPIKDFYIMPFPHNSKLPSVLLPIEGPGFEENRQHSLVGIMVVHSRTKRLASVPPPLTPIPSKIMRKDQLPSDRSYTPPPPLHLLPGSVKDEGQDAKQSLSVISKIVPELSSKITLESSSSSDKMHLNDDDDDDDEPYSPGEPVDLPLDDDDEDALSSSSDLKMSQITTETSVTFTTVVGVSSSKSSTELQRKMEELSRQIEEEKMQIQNISSSFLGDSSTTLPGLGLDPPDSNDAGEAYSPSDARSFTPPPQGIPKLSQPILEKVSNITIPANLQEILANVKRQESSKVDPYLPSKPGATFLTSSNSTAYSPTYSKTTSAKSSSDVQSSPRKETKSTLSSLSDYDLMKKAEEELAALAAADAASASLPTEEPVSAEPPPPGTSFESPHR